MLKDNVWSCVARDHDVGKNYKFTYEILQTGTYAVIFYPNIPTIDFIEDEFCGIICKDKKLVFIYIFMGIPALFSILYLTYKMLSNKLFN